MASIHGSTPAKGVDFDPICFQILGVRLLQKGSSLSQFPDSRGEEAGAWMLQKGVDFCETFFLPDSWGEEALPKGLGGFKGVFSFFQILGVRKPFPRELGGLKKGRCLQSFFQILGVSKPFQREFGCSNRG